MPMHKISDPKRDSNESAQAGSNPLFDIDALQVADRISSGSRQSKMIFQNQQRKEKTADQILDYLNTVNNSGGRPSS